MDISRFLAPLPLALVWHSARFGAELGRIRGAAPELATLLEPIYGRNVARSSILSNAFLVALHGRALHAQHVDFGARAGVEVKAPRAQLLSPSLRLAHNRTHELDQDRRVCPSTSGNLGSGARTFK